MKVLVTGGQGQLGRELYHIAKERGHEVVAVGRNELDITNLEECFSIVQNEKPDVIFHCAAFTAVDEAETQVTDAFKINAFGSRNIALAASKAAIKLVYISTDYVFDGAREIPYHEYENTSPLNIYGHSKRAGEILVQNLITKLYIVRTSWVFGAYGQNFVKSMIKLIQSTSRLQVVNDQRGSPTYTKDLAQKLLELVDTEYYGTYHVTNSGDCSWYEFARAIEEEMRSYSLTINAEIKPCDSSEYPQKAKRPHYSVMDSIALECNGFGALRSWREALTDFMTLLYSNRDGEKNKI
ncbi:dTDP-4-dehydrorhamnose reductase [Cohnella sp. GCM10012308]|uniref:dTDP-4-dehydrorhamnose reductase n=1 Tax=Cohnella sp. GCM10012308 TaxID=3317329 RepID=UPI00361775AA